MQDCTLVVLGAGSSSRFEHKAKKQWLRIEDIPLWLLTTNRLKKYADFKKIIVVGHKDEINYMKNYSNQLEFVEGGDSRQESMSNALNVVDSKFVMVTDVARCCVPQDVINELFENKDIIIDESSNFKINFIFSDNNEVKINSNTNKYFCDIYTVKEQNYNIVFNLKNNDDSSYAKILEFMEEIRIE